MGARRDVKGRTDYTLRVRVNPETQPVAVASVERTCQALQAQLDGLNQLPATLLRRAFNGEV